MIKIGIKEYVVGRVEGFFFHRRVDKVVGIIVNGKFLIGLV